MASANCTEDLRHILRARFTELGVSFETVDNLAGLPARYTAKILGPVPVRNFGQISLDALLGAAGLKLLVVEDEAAMARIHNRLIPLERIDNSGAHPKRVKHNFSLAFMRQIGSLGGKKTATVVSRKRYISRVNRANVMKRWAKGNSSPNISEPGSQSILKEAENG
jgi:hypothetical protein